MTNSVDPWRLLLTRSFDVPDVVGDEAAFRLIGRQLVNHMDDDAVTRLFGPEEQRDAELKTLLATTVESLSRGRLDDWLTRPERNTDTPVPRIR